MRTRKFQHIFNRVVSLHGRNPRKEMPPDMPRAILYHINERVREAVQGWPWPEWNVTEERSYRQVWRIDHQYRRVSAVDGNPDAVFYIPNTTYYQVLPTAASDPPIGNVPTDTNYWAVLDPVDAYIAYDQPCKRSIGMATGIYSQDPRLNKCGSNGAKLCYHPSEFGIDICNPPGPTVFICYSMPTPVYTMLPYVAGKTYPRGSVAFDFNTGEVFQALNDTNALLSDSTNWSWVPFLEKWESYVVNAAFADTLYEFDQGGNDDLQARSVIAEKYEAKAKDSLQGEIDALQAQGQVLHYSFCRPCNMYWCESADWGGGTVTTLTDACQAGWVYPSVPPSSPQVLMQWIPTIMSLSGPLQPALNALPTVALPVNYGVQISILVGGSLQEQTWQLRTGSADPLDPGNVQPLDHDPAKNNVFWYKIS